MASSQISKFNQFQKLFKFIIVNGHFAAAQIITSGGACGDRALLQRMMNLLNQPLLKWEDIVNPNFAEWVGCKVGSLKLYLRRREVTPPV